MRVDSNSIYEKTEGFAHAIDANRIAAEGHRAEAQEIVDEIVAKVKSHKAEFDGVAKKVEARRAMLCGCRGVLP